MGDVMSGNCEICEDKNVLLDRKYYHYARFKMVNYCKKCAKDTDKVDTHFHNKEEIDLIETFDTNLQLGLDIVKRALKRDDSYYDVFKDNIAMCFQDAYKETDDIHTISNKGADMFLQLLIKNI